MRGPFDDAIEPGQEQPAAAAARREAAPRKPKPPGGKALMRLLQMVETAGYSGIAEQTIEQAVPPQSRQVVRGQQPHVATAQAQPARARGTRRRRAEAEALETPTAAAAESTEVAATHAMAAAKTLGAPVAGRPQWRSLGPWTIPDGQTYGATRINVSGRVAAIAIDPSDPAHVLCGAANGGVWESRDRGASWDPRTDFAPTLAVGALAFDPSNPHTVYCGTGEGNWWWWLGAGLLRSTDGGTNWSLHCSAPFVGLGFYDLIVDPADSSHLVAATTGGLFVSTNGGIDWDHTRVPMTWSLSMDPAGGAGAEILAACKDGLFESTDGGVGWTPVALPGAPPEFTRLAVAIAQSNPAVAYAWGAGPPSMDPDPRIFIPTPYLWRRDGGAWSAIDTPPGVATVQAWYDWFLAVSPDTDEQIYCGAIEVHRGALSGGAWHWQNLSAKGPGQDSIHPDQHVIAFEPGNPDQIYVGNDGGLYRSPNRGFNWTSCNNGLVISEFEYIAQHPGNARWIIGGTQDNGTERFTGSPIWEHVADGDGGDCGVNRTNPDVVYHTFYGMSPERSDTGGDFGSWTWIGPPVPSDETSLFYPPFECSATSGDTIAIGGGALDPPIGPGALYVSRDNGTFWTRLPFPAPATATAIFIPNGELVYVGTGQGELFVTWFSSGAWSALHALPSPRTNASISDIFVQPTNIDRIWLTCSTVGNGRVFRTDNGGAHWDDCTTGLPQLPINAIAVDDANPSRAWVCADVGVYESVDAGRSWSDFSNGLPNMYVGDLAFHPHARLLRAGTRSRGVWEIDVDGALAAPICGVQFNGRLAGNEEQTWFTHSWPSTWHVLWTVMPTIVSGGSPQLTWSVQTERASAEHTTYWIKVKNLTAQPIDFEGRYCILSRY